MRDKKPGNIDALDGPFLSLFENPYAKKGP